MNKEYGQDFEYELNEDEKSYSVIGIVNSINTNIVIPEEYRELLVTEIGCNAFEGCKYVKRVKMSNSIKIIGNYEFFRVYQS